VDSKWQAFLTWVGCLWPAGDADCVEVAKEFYSSIFRDIISGLRGGDVATALQEAVIKVREAGISMPLNWARFFHFRA
jgi:hypothetical protein